MSKKNAPLKGFIYFWHNASLLLLDSFEAAVHRHYPMEFYIGLEAPFEMDIGEGWKEYRAVIIDSNRAHSFKAGNGWQALFMFDPVSGAAQCLRRGTLRGKRFGELDVERLTPFVSALIEFKNRPHSYDEARILCNDLLCSVSNNASHVEPSERRVSEIIRTLRNLPEKKIKAEELAGRFALSESRLAHIFKHEPGITLRHYLLWLRLMEAARLIFKGMPFTDAAYEAGFADSAHLSRTYKEMCGLNLSDLLNRPSSIKLMTD